MLLAICDVCYMNMPAFFFLVPPQHSNDRFIVFSFEVFFHPNNRMSVLVVHSFGAPLDLHKQGVNFQLEFTLFGISESLFDLVFLNSL